MIWKFQNKFKLKIIAIKHFPKPQSGITDTFFPPVPLYYEFHIAVKRGWSGGAMVLGKLPVPGLPTNLNYSRARPIVLAVGAGGGCLDIFSLIYPFSPLSPSLWKTA